MIVLAAAALLAFLLDPRLCDQLLHASAKLRTRDQTKDARSPGLAEETVRPWSQGGTRGTSS
jgi:hypothetical protein